MMMKAKKKAIGFILSLEGADSLITLDHLHRAYEYGLRAIGPAHYGPGRYANGTDATGKMNENGLHLLKEMEKLNIILDATHLCDDAFWQAMDHFHGHAIGQVIIIAVHWWIITASSAMNK